MLKTSIATVIITLSFILSGNAFAQSSNLEQENEPNYQEVVHQLKEVYGPYYTTYYEGETETIQFYVDFFNRCEFIPLSEAPEGIDNISVLGLLDKYNPEEIYHDNSTTFNADDFILLKYRFDYDNKTDRYFRIYQTNTVLKINKVQP